MGGGPRNKKSHPAKGSSLRILQADPACSTLQPSPAVLFTNDGVDLAAADFGSDSRIGRRSGPHAENACGDLDQVGVEGCGSRRGSSVPTKVRLTEACSGVQNVVQKSPS